MKEYQHKRLWRNVVYSKATMIVLAIMCMLLLRSIMSLYAKYQKVHTLQEESKKEEEKIHEKVIAMQVKNEALQTTRGKEEYIRKTYPVIESGEHVIVVVEATSSPVVLVRKDISFTEKVKLFLQSWFN